MNLVKDNIKKRYYRYLADAFGSSLISTIYGRVDSIVIGKYAGPDGSAARAVMAPLWNIVFSFGLLFGIGGSVFFSALRGKGKEFKKESNEYFTISIIGGIVFSIICRIRFFCFDKPIFRALGADDARLKLCDEYLLPVKFAVPAYLFSQILAAFLRNDSNPTLATVAVLIGGIFNVFADFFFVFTLKLGLFGAGLATAIGNTLSVLLRCIHFFSKKKNTLRIVKPEHFFKKTRNIVSSGFSTFVVDAAMGIVTALRNNQIRKYLGSDALAVYGVIVYRSTCVQCCAYSVGQAAQPIFSANYGAKQYDRIKETLIHSIISSIFFALLWTVLRMAIPNGFVKLRRNATDEVLLIAPRIIRLYSISFLLLPLNIFSTYYFQSIRKPGIALFVSIRRGAVISSILIETLPLFRKDLGIWLARPFTEVIIFAVIVYFTIRYTKKRKKSFEGQVILPKA